MGRRSKQEAIGALASAFREITREAGSIEKAVAREIESQKTAIKSMAAEISGIQPASILPSGVTNWGSLKLAAAAGKVREDAIKTVQKIKNRTLKGKHVVPSAHGPDLPTARVRGMAKKGSSDEILDDAASGSRPLSMTGRVKSKLSDEQKAIVKEFEGICSVAGPNSKVCKKAAREAGLQDGLLRRNAGTIGKGVALGISAIGGAVYLNTTIEEHKSECFCSCIPYEECKLIVDDESHPHHEKCVGPDGVGDLALCDAYRSQIDASTQRNKHWPNCIKDLNKKIGTSGEASDQKKIWETDPHSYKCAWEPSCLPKSGVTSGGVYNRCTGALVASQELSAQRTACQGITDSTSNAALCDFNEQMDNPLTGGKISGCLHLFDNESEFSAYSNSDVFPNWDTWTDDASAPAQSNWASSPEHTWVNEKCIDGDASKQGYCSIEEHGACSTENMVWTSGLDVVPIDVWEAADDIDCLVHPGKCISDYWNKNKTVITVSIVIFIIMIIILITKPWSWSWGIFSGGDE
jgi:hypothetical protein